MSPYTVPLSLLLSSCALCAGVATAGEVAKDEKHLRRWDQISFYHCIKRYIYNNTINITYISNIYH